MLSRYALERLLQRISQSSHRDRFVIKGAILFQIWCDHIYRPTRDIDFLAQGAYSIAYFEGVFREVCRQNVEDDGLSFAAESIAGYVIKPDHEYQGIRILLEAKLERARIPVQIDVGFGDAMTPGPQEIQYPSLLGFPAPIVSVYPRETVVAEKFQAMLVLGMANSRMKDFFDLWLLANHFEFDGLLLARAIRATLDRRRTPIPETIPTAFTPAFHKDDAKQKQWKAFLAKSRLVAPAMLSDVMIGLQAFLLPLVDAIKTGRDFRLQWVLPGRWESSEPNVIGPR
jgi:hypothetical protein